MSRWTGLKPASRMMRRSSSSVAPPGLREALFEQDRADVVAAEAEAHLQDLEALGGPGALQVGDVVEVEAADGEGGEVLDCGGLGDVGGDDCRAGLRGQWGEGGEASGLFLEGAEDFEVVDTIGEGFADAEDHGGLGWQAQLMGGAVDADPFRGGAFVGGGALADLVVEDDGVRRRWSRGRRRWRRAMVSRRERFSEAESATISVAERPWSWTSGKRCLMPRKRDSKWSRVTGWWVDGRQVEAGGAHVYGLAGAGVGGFEVGVGAGEEAVDGVADDAFGVEGAAERVGLHADADEVVGGEAVEGLLAGDSHEAILRFGVDGTGWRGFGGARV